MKSYDYKPEEIPLSADNPEEIVDQPVLGKGEIVLPADDMLYLSHEPANEERVESVDNDEILDIPEGEYREYSVNKSLGGRKAPPSREQILTAVAFWGVVLLGAILRFWGLGDKPLHHDESLHAYFSLQLLHNNIENWAACLGAPFNVCYRYDPLLHGPFQFHMIALIYKISQLLGAADHGVNTTTVRIGAATLGTLIVALPYFLRHYVGKVGAWLACFLLAVSPSMVYFSRFAREDIYMACFTLLLVVALANYVRTRKAYFLVLAGAAFSLSYATKEATFLTIAVFGSFFGAVIIWELAGRWAISSKRQTAASPEPAGVAGEADVTAVSDDEIVKPDVSTTGFRRFLPRTMALYALLGYFLVLGVVAKIFFGWLKGESIYINASKANQAVTDAFVNHLKTITDLVIPWLGILLSIIVFIILMREQSQTALRAERRGLARHVDPQKQPLLDTVVSMPWTHWFFALVTAGMIFLILFTALFTYLPQGIGDGVWQGLYYWIQQQQVARGGQPWYYYFMLIPLYEQIGLVFGLVGVVRCLLKPSRFRLFLVYWFLGNVFIYSWAGEKMPWLSIHMTLPMLLLAGIGLEPAVTHLLELAKLLFVTTSRALRGNAEFVFPEAAQPVRSRGVLATGGAIFVVVMALLLLLPTLQNMYQLTYDHPADGPREMMIYVQTSTDVNTVMAKVDALDQKLYGGKHKLPIGLMPDATWPFAWYLRDYTSVCFQYPTNCNVPDVPVIIAAAGDNLSDVQAQYGKAYNYRAYQMRTQWDQGYMPLPCITTKTHVCDPQPYSGVGPLTWLSYGNNVPQNQVGKFDLGRIATNVWRWWWQRVPFGGVDGGYEMNLLIRKDLGVNP